MSAASESPVIREWIERGVAAQLAVDVEVARAQALLAIDLARAASARGELSDELLERAFGQTDVFLELLRRLPRSVWR